MIGYFLICFSSFLVISAVTLATRKEGDIFHDVRAKLKSSADRGMFPKKLAKPLLLCETCMSSIWGSLIYVVAHLLFDLPGTWQQKVALGILNVAGTATITALFWQIFVLIEEQIAYLKQMQKALNDEA